MEELVLRPGRRFAGELSLPGDKSVSHRALMLSSLAHGRSHIENLGDGEAVLRTASCLRALGVRVGIEGPRAVVDGEGPEGLAPAKKELDAGGSATTLRLLMGVLAGRPFPSRLTGDAALSARPMERVAVPLRLMGAGVGTGEGGGAPVRIEGARLKGIRYDSPVASAQLKSAVLLAGLQAEGETSFTEPLPSRDHTERMLKHYGSGIRQEGRTVLLTGGEILKGRDVRIPGDISTAGFFLAGACLAQEGDVLLRSVLLNPTRTGLLDVLLDMGADLDTESRGGDLEPFGHVSARSSELNALELGPEKIPAVIDELPVVAVLATQARGKTVVRGAGELRLKESDRIASVAAMLRSLGGRIETYDDGFAVEGPQRLQGGSVDPAGDHRLAMAAAVASLAAEGPVRILSPGCASASCPGFFELFGRLAA